MVFVMRWLGWGRAVESHEHQIQESDFQPSITGNNEKVLEYGNDAIVSSVTEGSRKAQFLKIA